MTKDSDERDSTQNRPRFCLLRNALPLLEMYSPRAMSLHWSWITERALCSIVRITDQMENDSGRAQEAVQQPPGSIHRSQLPVSLYLSCLGSLERASPQAQPGTRDCRCNLHETERRYSVRTINDIRVL